MDIEKRGALMKEINIGRTLVEKRKEKELTQDEVANYMGVSKSSVSKWETGQSYPDITFLPMLASYFDISVDELIGYEPQMTKEDIRKNYIRFTTEFVEQPFDEVMTKVYGLIKKYHSCYPLLLQMGILMLNHCNLEKNPDKITLFLEEIKKLFHRIKEESKEVETVKQAVFLEAYCALALGKPVETLEIIGEKATMMMSPEVLLSSAYQMIGQVEKADEILQAGIYQHMMSLLELLISHLTLKVNEHEKFEEILQRILGMVKLFDLEHLHPTMLMSVYLATAQGYAQQKNQEKCLKTLQQYTELVLSDIYPIYIKGDAFFDLIESWIKQLDLGNHMPRDEKAVKQSMVEAVSENPAFLELHERKEFKQIVMKLRRN